MEISKDDERAELSEKAKEAYTLAEKVAENLSPTHPIRLGLALNFSVYYYEIAQNPQEACDLAKKAFDAAIAKLDSTSEDTYKAAITKYSLEKIEKGSVHNTLRSYYESPHSDNRIH